MQPQRIAAKGSTTQAAVSLPKTAPSLPPRLGFPPRALPAQPPKTHARPDELRARRAVGPAAAQCARMAVGPAGLYTCRGPDSPSATCVMKDTELEKL